MTDLGHRDYEPDFAAAIGRYWLGRQEQAARQREAGKVDAGTRGQVTGGKHLDGMAELVGRVLTDAGMVVGARKLPGYYRRDKTWDVVATYDGVIAAVVELKSHVGSIGNNANNRIEEMIGQSVDLWKAARDRLLGPVPPWFGYFLLVEDGEASNAVAPAPRVPPQFAPDEIFAGTSYIDRYRIAFARLRLERDMNQVCLVASRADGTYRYPDASMSFNAFSTSLVARAAEVRSQFGG